MAIPVFHTEAISRQPKGKNKNGRSAVAVSAYQSGEKLKDERTGKTFNYTYKEDVVIYKATLAPDDAPDWAYDPKQLWNRAEQRETRCNSRTAREFILTLPIELTLEQHINLVEAFAKNRVAEGMVIEIAIHYNEGNPHAHLLAATRAINQNGFQEKVRTWDTKEQLELWREDYQNITNAELEKAGSLERIDARSYKKQGLDRLPGKHLGPYLHKLEKQGIPTLLGNLNREIEAKNREREPSRKQQEALEQQRLAELQAAAARTPARDRQREYIREQRRLLEAELGRPGRHAKYEEYATYKLLERQRNEDQQQKTREGTYSQSGASTSSSPSPPLHHRRPVEPGTQRDLDLQKPYQQEEAEKRPVEHFRPERHREYGLGRSML